MLRRESVKLLKWGKILRELWTHLPLADHVDDFDAAEGDLSGSEGLEAQHRPRNTLHRTMILLHNVVEVFALSAFDLGVEHVIVAFDRSSVRATLVDVDLREKTKRSSRISFRREEEINRVTRFVDGESRPGEFHPRPLAERCVNLSTHTAPIRQTRPSSRLTSDRTDRDLSFTALLDP